MDIRVTDTERRSNGQTSNYVAYNIETEVEEDISICQAGTFDVWRRYSEFLALRKYLSFQYPAVVLPGLPPKVSFGFDEF